MQMALYTGVKRPRTPSSEEPALSESRYVTIENSKIRSERAPIRSEWATKTLHESPLIHPRTPKVARFLRISE